MIEEVRAGFLWDDQVLRTAEVIVSKGGAGKGDATMTDEIVGIDLGTTNSEIAVYRDGRPEVLGDEQGRLILPSVVGLSETGRTARRRGGAQPVPAVSRTDRPLDQAADGQRRRGAAGRARLHAAGDLRDHPVAAEGDRPSTGWDGRSARR